MSYYDEFTEFYDFHYDDIEYYDDVEYYNDVDDIDYCNGLECDITSYEDDDSFYSPYDYEDYLYDEECYDDEYYSSYDDYI